MRTRTDAFLEHVFQLKCSRRPCCSYCGLIAKNAALSTQGLRQATTWAACSTPCNPRPLFPTAKRPLPLMPASQTPVGGSLQRA